MDAEGGLDWNPATMNVDVLDWNPVAMDFGLVADSELRGGMNADEMELGLMSMAVDVEA